MYVCVYAIDMCKYSVSLVVMEIHIKLMKNFTSRLSVKADNIKC